MIPEYVSLERAIANFKNNQTQTNAEVLRDKLIRANYYLFLHPSLYKKENINDYQKVQARLRAGRFEQIPILLFDTHSKAGHILPVFTSRLEAEKFPVPGISDLVEIGFPALYGIIQNSPKASSLLINPEGNAIAFNRTQFLNSFAAYGIEVSKEEAEPGTTVTFQQAKDAAPRLAASSLRHEARKMSDVSRIWLTRQINEDNSFRWFLVVESDKQRRDGHQQLAAIFLQSLGSGSAGICYSDVEMAADIVAQFEPFYSR